MISAVAPAASSRRAEAVSIFGGALPVLLVVQRAELREVEAFDQQRRARLLVGGPARAVDVLVVGPVETQLIPPIRPSLRITDPFTLPVGPRAPDRRQG